MSPHKEYLALKSTGDKCGRTAHNPFPSSCPEQFVLYVHTGESDRNPSLELCGEQRATPTTSPRPLCPVKGVE